MLFGTPPIRPDGPPQPRACPGRQTQRVLIILRVVYRFDEIIEHGTRFFVLLGINRGAHTHSTVAFRHAPITACPESTSVSTIRIMSCPAKRTVFMREPFPDYLPPGPGVPADMPSGTYVTGLITRTRYVDRRTRLFTVRAATVCNNDDGDTGSRCSYE